MKKYMKKENHVGSMRWDFADGETALANTWFPYQTLSKEDIAEIQPEINRIIFEKYNTFSSIIEECGGTSYDHLFIKHQESKHFVYAIKLIPVKGDYNGYVFVYRKDDLND